MLISNYNVVNAIYEDKYDGNSMEVDGIKNEVMKCDYLNISRLIRFSKTKETFLDIFNKNALNLKTPLSSSEMIDLMNFSAINVFNEG